MAWANLITTFQSNLIMSLHRLIQPVLKFDLCQLTMIDPTTPKVNNWGTKSWFSQTHWFSIGTVLLNSDLSKAQPSLQPTTVVSDSLACDGQPSSILSSLELFQKRSSFWENSFGIRILQLLGAKMPSGEISFGRKQSRHSATSTRLRLACDGW